MSRSPFDPGYQELPRRLPVFPLEGVLLLPGGRLPLNIFEPRYLAMVEDALRGDRMIGMIQPLQPQRDNGPPPIYDIGCAGRIVEFKETSDGRYLITLRGLIRFSVASELPETRGYRLVEPCFERYARDLECEPALIDREALLSALEVYFACNGIEGNWETIRETSDEKLVTSLAMICPFEPSEKQALLECETLTQRAETMTQIMGMAVLDAGGIDPAKH